MDIRQLEMFAAVAENLSFTQASTQLHVSQSAISRQVRLLEEELGEQVFKRLNRRVYLTEAGETLLRYARRILVELRNAAMEISEIANLNRGRITIGAGMTACIYLLPPVLENFKSKYPNVEQVVVTGPTGMLLEQIRHNRLDVGVLSLASGSPDLEVVPICTEELVVVCSPRERSLAGRKVMNPNEIETFPMLLFPKDTSTRQIIDDFFKTANVRPRTSMESENVATIKPLVAIGLGISILPHRAVQTEVKRGELHYLRLRGHKLSRSISLVFHRADSRPRALTELIQLFRNLG